MSADILNFPPPFQVSRSIPRILTIAGKQWRAYTEDWGSANACEIAMEHVLEFARSTTNPAPNWAGLADLIMIALDVPVAAPFGFNVIAERIDENGVICRDGLPQDASAGEI